MQYKSTSKTARQIAEDLGGIDALVEGVVQLSGNRLQVTVSLIHGASERKLQTAVYQRDVSEIFPLYSDIAQSAAREFRIAITPQQQARLTASRRPDPEAYDAYLKGRYQYARFGGQEPPETAIRHYEDAIAKDPAFAQAYAALALALREVGTAWGRRDWAVRQALALDSNLPEAHVALGLIRMRDWDWSGSESAFKQAIKLDPNLSVAHQWYAEFLRHFPARQRYCFSRCVLTGPDS